MLDPVTHKIGHTRILKLTQEIGWCFVPRAEAEARRGFDRDGLTPEDCARPASLFFGDLLHYPITAQLRVHALDLPVLNWFLGDHAQ